MFGRGPYYAYVIQSINKNHCTKFFRYKISVVNMNKSVRHCSFVQILCSEYGDQSKPYFKAQFIQSSVYSLVPLLKFYMLTGKM